MARPWLQRRRGGAAVPLALLLLLCLGDAAAVSTPGPGWKEGGDARAGQEVARWRLVTEEAAAVTERAEMEVVEDYPYVGANNRHNPHP